MSGLNKVFLLGNLGRDPELRYTRNKTPVCNFTLATNEVWNDRDGQKQERTEWHRIVVWGQQGELAAKALRKGSQVFVEGSVTTRSWEDREGQKRYVTEIKAQNVRFLDRRGEGSAPAPGGPLDGGEPFQGQDPEYPEDDIPF
jgi:single-strand DNA-binding protein